MKPDSAVQNENQPKQRRGRVYLRGGTWWADFSHKGTRHRRPLEGVTSERKAWDKLETLRTEARQSRRLEVESARWSHLAQRFTTHHEAKGTSAGTMRRYTQILAHLNSYFGSSPVDEIAESVNGYVALRRRQKAAAASIRAELAVLKQAHRLAGLALSVPGIEVRNVRRGFLEADDVERIAANLPPYLRPVAWTGFYTGWRKSEILNLEWRDVNLAAGTVRLWPDTTKSGDGRVFPLAACSPLARLIADQREGTKALGRIVSHVFHHRGEPIRDMDDAWRTACKAAGKPGALFHDLRRSFALDMRRRGLSETDIMALAGWRTPSMFRRYCVADETGLAERLRRAYGTTSAQTAESGGGR